MLRESLTNNYFNMINDQIRDVLRKLANHEERIAHLEGSVVTPAIVAKSSGKQKTLREIVKGRKFKNGQEQLAVIVGYHEVNLQKPISKTVLKDEWLAAKMRNKFDGKFLERAKDIYFRIHPDDTCVLTQTGEEFFDQFLKNESATPTSK